MSKPKAAARAAGWIAVGAVAASGVGVATAATTSGGGSAKPNTAVTTSAVTPAATTPSTSPSGKHPRRGLARLLVGRVLHGQATVLGKDGKPVQVAEQRGTVQAVSATSITLKSKDGFTQTYAVTPTTHVRVDGKKSSIANVKANDQAGVVAKVNGTTQTANLVIERAPKAGTVS